MPIHYKKNRVSVVEVASVEEAESLLAWLQDKKSPKVNLGQCTHLHPAVLQVLMASNVSVTDWPEDDKLCSWLRSALTS